MKNSVRVLFTEKGKLAHKQNANRIFVFDPKTSTLVVGAREENHGQLYWRQRMPRLFPPLMAIRNALPLRATEWAKKRLRRKADAKMLEGIKGEISENGEIVVAVSQSNRATFSKIEPLLANALRENGLKGSSIKDPLGNTLSKIK